jgi:hypothetical protein
VTPEHLPALQVVLPLISAPLIVLVRRERFAWTLAVLVSWISLAISVALFLQVSRTGVISYAIGSWPPPWGIEYRVDALNSFVLVIVSLTAAVVAPYARVSVAAELPREQEYLLFAMLCLCLAGLLGITITGDVFNVFVFLEIASLSTYVMIALGQQRKALVAAYQYLIMGTIGATFYVIGIGLLLLMTGTLNMADLARRLEGVNEIRPLLAAFAFISVGVGLKLALFPLHQWLPNAYTFAPSVVSAFVAATATKVSAYVLIRFYFTVFGTRPVRGAPDRRGAPGAVARRDRYGLAGRGVSAGPQAHVRVFERGANRLHHARPEPRHPGRAHRVDRAPAEPLRHEGRDLPLDRRHCAAQRDGELRSPARDRTPHAAHRIRPGRGRAEPGRRSRYCRLHHEVVPRARGD